MSVWLKVFDGVKADIPSCGKSLDGRQFGKHRGQICSKSRHVADCSWMSYARMYTWFIGNKPVALEANPLRDGKRLD